MIGFAQESRNGSLCWTHTALTLTSPSPVGTERPVVVSLGGAKAFDIDGVEEFDNDIVKEFDDDGIGGTTHDGLESPDNDAAKGSGKGDVKRFDVTGLDKSKVKESDEDGGKELYNNGIEGSGDRVNELNSISITVTAIESVSLLSDTAL